METTTYNQTGTALHPRTYKHPKVVLSPQAGNQYLTLVSNLSVGVYRNTPGPKGHFLEANPAIVAMFEAASKEEFLRHNVSDFYADPRMRKLFAAKIMKHGFVKDEQLELVTLKGKRFVGSVTATRTKDEHGNTCFDGIIEDITERKKAAEILQQMETQGRLERTLDHMVDGCQIISPDFRYAYINHVAAKQGRKTKDELLGHTMMEVYPGIEKTKMFSFLKRCMKNRKTYSMDNEFKFADGSTGWFELKLEPVPEGVLIFSADITKRKNYEATISIRNQQLEALNKVEEDTRRALLNVMEDLEKANEKIELEKVKDRAILENIGEGLIVVDAHGMVIMVNKAAEALLGQAAALHGKKVTSLQMLDEAGRTIPAALRPISAVLESGKTIGPSVAEYYYVRKDKQKFPLGIIVTPVKLDGKIIGAIEVFRDVTKEQEIDKAKTEFVSIASHQLRTPLGIAKWYLEAVKEAGYLDQMPKAGKDYLKEVYKSNERVLKVVRELLSVSRIDQGRIRDDRKLTDAVRLVKDIVHEMIPAAEGKNIKLGLKIKRAQQFAHMHIDQLRLHEVVQNLIVNALEYTLPGGSITVLVEKRGRSFVISVADTGIGVAEKDQPRLFTKFFRSEKAALQNPDGSGLGLYVVKSYVESWGGKVSVRSQAGKGSTFTVTLPSKGDKHEKSTDH